MLCGPTVWVIGERFALQVDLSKMIKHKTQYSQCNFTIHRCIQWDVILKTWGELSASQWRNKTVYVSTRNRCQFGSCRTNHFGINFKWRVRYYRLSSHLAHYFVPSYSRNLVEYDPEPGQFHCHSWIDRHIRSKNIEIACMQCLSLASWQH